MPVLQSEQKPFQVISGGRKGLLGLQKADEVLEFHRVEELLCLEHIKLKEVKSASVVHRVKTEIWKEVIWPSVGFSHFAREEGVVPVENGAAQNHQAHVDRGYATH